MKWYAVVGRIPGQDEDSVHTFFAASLQEAVEQFEKIVYDESPYDLEVARRGLEAGEDSVVYLTAVLSSDSPIYTTLYCQR